MTDEEVVAELRSGSARNKARRCFSSWRVQLGQMSGQRNPPSPVETRRIEFQAVREIGRVLNAEMLEALEKLADAASGFNVSGVYFNEDGENKALLARAYALLEKLKACLLGRLSMAARRDGGRGPRGKERHD
jgi:hypothetical protein